MANFNISAATHALVKSGVVEKVYQKHVLLRWIMEGGEIKEAESGFPIEQPEMSDDMLNLVQDFGVNDRQTAGAKTILQRAAWGIRRKQVPLFLNDDVRVAMSNNKLKVVDLVATQASNALKAMRESLTRNFMALGITKSSTAIPTATSDTNVYGFQSIDQACSVSVTYGGIARSSAAFNYWRGASITQMYSASVNYAGTAQTAYSDQTLPTSNTLSATAYPGTLDTLRKAIGTVTQYPDVTEGELLAVTGPDYYRKLQVEAQSQRLDTSGSLVAKWGFTAMKIDNVEVVREPRLNNAVTLGASQKLYVLWRPSWHIRLDPEYNFHTTKYVQQSDRADGIMGMLARLYVMGSLYCDAPPANLMTFVDYT